MARTICGFVYGSKEIRKRIEGTVADMILKTSGAEAVYNTIIDSDEKGEPFQYFVFGFPNGGCFVARHSSLHQLRLTLHFVGSEELYKGEDSLAEKILKYWEDEEVRIGRDR